MKKRTHHHWTHLIALLAVLILTGCTTNNVLAPPAAPIDAQPDASSISDLQAKDSVAGGSFAQRGVSEAEPLAGFDDRNTVAQAYVQPGRNLEASHKSKQGKWRLWERLWNAITGNGSNVAGVKVRTSDTSITVEHADAVHLHIAQSQQADKSSLGSGLAKDVGGNVDQDPESNLTLDVTGQNNTASPRTPNQASGGSTSEQAVDMILERIANRIIERRAPAAQPTAPVAPPPAATNAPTAPAGALAGFDWRYGGEDFSGAVLDPAVVISGFAFDSNECRYSVTDYTAPIWGTVGSGEAIACVFAATDGPGKPWVGGKFEGAPADRRSRPWSNIRSGYKGWIEPASGTPFAFVLVEVDGKRHSNLAFGIWP